MAARRLPAQVQAAIDQAERQDTRPRAARMALVLEFPPSTNNLYRTFVEGGKARRVKTGAAKNYTDHVMRVVRLWLHSHDARPPGPPYRLSFRAFPPLDNARHDLTNCFKCPEDALMAAIGGDDVNVVHVVGTKMPRDHHPRLEVILEGSTE